MNAVATALKDFFSKQMPSVFEKDVMKELEEIAGKFDKYIKDNLFYLRYHGLYLIDFPIRFIFLLLVAASVLSRGGPPSSLNMEVKTDRSCRLLALRSLLNKLPPINFNVLKYIFQHFVRYVNTPPRPN